MMAAVALLMMAAAPLTEEQAVAMALQNSPRMRWHGHHVEETAALTDAGVALNNPLLRIGGLRYGQLVEPALARRAYDADPFEHTTVALRWSPPGLGARSARRAEGRVREAEARVELAVAHRDTTAQVRKLHAQILSFDAQLALVRDVVGQHEQLRRLVERRLELATATRLDQSLTEVDYLEARTVLGELESRRRAAYDELLIELGLPVETALVLAPAREACAAPADAAQLAGRARASDPRLRLYVAERAALLAEKAQRKLALVPWFDHVQVSYGAGGAGRAGFVALQLQLSLPVLDLKGPHRRALAARERARSEKLQVDQRALSQLVLRTTAQQAAQFVLVERYRAAASVVERGVRDLREALAHGGATSLAEVVQLQARLLATQRAYLRAQLDCKLQQIELDRLTSTVPDGDR